MQRRRVIRKAIVSVLCCLTILLSACEGKKALSKSNLKIIIRRLHTGRVRQGGLENMSALAIDHAAYKKLLLQYEPHAIESDEDNERALAVCSTLAQKGEDLSPEELVLLGSGANSAKGPRSGVKN
jgi:hypothetical protein